MAGLSLPAPTRPLSILFERSGASEGRLHLQTSGADAVTS
jgi:hypothetical protein